MKHYEPGKIEHDGTVDMRLSKAAMLEQMLKDAKEISSSVRLLNKQALDKLKRVK